MALSETQHAALVWINIFPCTKAGWRRNGKSAYGPPEKWNGMELSGSQGSILVHVTDWEAIRGFLDCMPAPNKIYGLNAAGRAALQEPR